MENFNKVVKEFTLGKGSIKIRRTSCSKNQLVVYELKTEEDNSVKHVQIALTQMEISESNTNVVKQRLRQGLDELKNSLPTLQAESRCFRCTGEIK